MILRGVKGQEELGWLRLVELRAWVRTSATLVGLSGGDGNLHVSFLACLVGREAVLGGKQIRRLDDAIPAMNQRNSFAAMTGCGLGHSPERGSWEQPSCGSRLPCVPLTRCCAVPGDLHLQLKPFTSLSAPAP